MSILRQVRRLLRPSRVVGVTRQPAGWFVVGRRLERVLAWAVLEDGRAVGLIAYRGGLRMATGSSFCGYLPAAPLSESDVQLEPPTVPLVVADLDEAIGDAANVWTSEAQSAIYARLRAAAELEWAGRSLSSFVADPERFLRRHFELLVEHGHPAELDDDWRSAFARINPHAADAAKENDHA